VQENDAKRAGFSRYKYPQRKRKKITLTPLYIFSYNLSRSSGLANHYINMWKLATEENLGQMHFSNLSQV
jgi:hypothetical protein